MKCKMFLPVAVVFVAASCASVPVEPKTPRPPSPSTKVANAPALVEAEPPVAAAMEHLPALGPGQCRDGFDCVDTVGFPASGYTWRCDEGKCARAKLPAIGGVATGSDGTEQPTAEADEKPVSKRPASRRRR